MNRRTFLSSLGIGLLSAPLLAKAATKLRCLGPVRFANYDDWAFEPASDGYVGFFVVYEKITRAVYRFGFNGAGTDRITARGPIALAEFKDHLEIHRLPVHLLGKSHLEPHERPEPPIGYITWREWEET